MVEIDSNKPDRQEERRAEERKQDHRRQIEKKMQNEPMKTFEAKLSEKTAQEKGDKDSVARNLHDLKKTKEEKQSLLDKILGVAKDKDSQQEKARVEGLQKHAKEEQAKEEKKNVGEEASRFDDMKKAKKEDVAQKAKKESSEQAQEGHKRVAEKEDGERGGSGGSGQGSEKDSGTGQRSLRQGSEFSGDKEDGEAFEQKVKDGLIAHVAGRQGFSSGTFDQNAKTFTPRDLDDIVSAVSLGINEKGEEEFSVELTDEYFDGLTLQAARTDQGVVLKFVCPNASVRSTFLKCRPTVYRHLKTKDIDVYRIDIV